MRAQPSRRTYSPPLQSPSPWLIRLDTPTGNQLLISTSSPLLSLSLSLAPCRALFLCIRCSSRGTTPICELVDADSQYSGAASLEMCGYNHNNVLGRAGHRTLLVLAAWSGKARTTRSDATTTTMSNVIRIASAFRPRVRSVRILIKCANWFLHCVS